MKKLPIPQAMAWKYGAKVSKTADGGDIATWEHPSLERPSVIQLMRDLDEYEAFTKANDYKRERAKEYDPLTDQIERITKCLDYLNKIGIDIGPDGLNQVLMVQSVKKKYPKPE